MERQPAPKVNKVDCASLLEKQPALHKRADCIVVEVPLDAPSLVVPRRAKGQVFYWLNLNVGQAPINLEGQRAKFYLMYLGT